jgi:phospholipase/carboxylesterase
MPLPCIEHDTAPNPSAAIVVLHGLGADGNDFVPFIEELRWPGMPALHWVFPHAPMRPVTINGGYVMRAWYDILGTELVRVEDEAGLRHSIGLVHELLDGIVARGIAAERIVLAGFSQGCAMTLLAGLRYPQRLAGLAGMSGYLPLAASTATERHAANAATPIFLAHGSQDPVVPQARGIASRDTLQSLGYAVQWHSYPMPHSVCAEEVADLQGFVQAVLPAQAA